MIPSGRTAGMPEILIVARSGWPFPSPPGGADAVAIRQALALAKQGLGVALVGQGALPPDDVPGSLTLVPAGVGRSIASRSQAGYYFKVLALSVLAGLRGVAFLREHPSIRVVHCHHSVIVGLFRAFAPERPLVLTVHDNPYSPSDPCSSGVERAVRILNNRLLERFGVDRADAVVAVSPEVAVRLGAWGVPSSRITEIWPTAAERSADVPRNPDRDPGLRPQAPYLLSVGDLTGRKRMDILVRALGSLPSELKLVVVGRGPRRVELEQLIRSLHLEDRVTIHEYVSDEMMFDLQRRATAGVLVSEREGLPTSLIEAVSVGTPSLYVTTRRVTVPNTEPFLVHRETSDPGQVAAAVQQIWDGLTHGEITRESVSAWAQRTFPTADSAARTLVELYASLERSRGLQPTAAGMR